MRRLIKRWVLTFFSECRVLEPEKLKETVRKDLSRNLNQYSTSPVPMNLIKKIRVVDKVKILNYVPSDHVFS